MLWAFLQLFRVLFIGGKMPYTYTTAGRGKQEVRALWCIMIALLALGAYSIHLTNRQAFIACKHVSDVQRYAVLTITRSEKTLPTIAYYKNPDHAIELRNQLRQLAESKQDFTPIVCHKKII